MTQENLFDVPETLSPRLAWLKKHEIKTLHRDDLSDEAGRWEAYVGEYQFAIDETFADRESGFYPDESPFLAWGETEDDAILELAKNNGWKLWNEES